MAGVLFDLRFQSLFVPIEHSLALICDQFDYIRVIMERAVLPVLNTGSGSLPICM